MKETKPNQTKVFSSIWEGENRWFYVFPKVIGFAFIVEWYISLRGLFNVTAFILEEQKWYYLTTCCGVGNKRVPAFHKDKFESER